MRCPSCFPSPRYRLEKKEHATKDKMDFGNGKIGHQKRNKEIQKGNQFVQMDKIRHDDKGIVIKLKRTRERGEDGTDNRRYEGIKNGDNSGTKTDEKSGCPELAGNKSGQGLFGNPIKPFADRREDHLGRSPNSGQGA